MGKARAVCRDEEQVRVGDTKGEAAEESRDELHDCQIQSPLHNLQSTTRQAPLSKFPRCRPI
jgi:hypothetical protein